MVHFSSVGILRLAFTLQVSGHNNTVISLSEENYIHWLASTVALLCLGD